MYVPICSQSREKALCNKRTGAFNNIKWNRGIMRVVLLSKINPNLLEILYFFFIEGS